MSNAKQVKKALILGCFEEIFGFYLTGDLNERKDNTSFFNKIIFEEIWSIEIPSAMDGSR